MYFLVGGVFSRSHTAPSPEIAGTHFKHDTSGSNVNTSPEKTKGRPEKVY